MIIAYITDLHWGARSDSKVFHRYFTLFYRNIFFPYLKKHNIEHVFCLGDLVDRRKYINYSTLNVLRNELILPCVENNIEFHSLVGNHDTPYRNSNEISSLSELFNEYENVYFYDKPETIELSDGFKMAMLPWINPTNYDECMEFVESTPANVLNGHLELSGFEMYKGLTSTHGLSPSVFERFSYVFTGHYHTRSTKGNIHYLGTPYQMTWGDYGDIRGFHLFDTETNELTFVKNPYNIFRKIWYDDSDKTISDYTNLDFSDCKDCIVKVIVKNKQNPFWFDKMIDALYKSSPEKISIVDDSRQDLQENTEDIISEAEDTMTILSKYVETAETNFSEELKSLFLEIYKEAQDLDNI